MSHTRRRALRRQISFNDSLILICKGRVQEYYDLTQEILKWYPNGHTPTAENLEKKIEVLTAQCSQKNAEYRAADRKARELSEASREIEEFLRQEQRRDQQKK